MKTNNDQHRGYIGRPGVIAEKAIRLPIGSLAQSQLEAALLAQAEGPGEIRCHLHKEKTQQSTADAQRRRWVDLIVKSQKNKS
jgi:hypothetical protein